MSHKHSYINPFTDLLLLEFNKLSISIFWISFNNSLIVVVFFLYSSNISGYGCLSLSASVLTYSINNLYCSKKSSKI